MPAKSESGPRRGEGGAGRGGWVDGRQTGSVHKLRGGGKTERRAAPRDICSPRRVAPHLQRNKFASSAFDGSSYPPSGFRSLSLSLCPFAPARDRERLHPSSTLSRIVESVKIRRIESKGSETSIIRSG